MRPSPAVARGALLVGPVLALGVTRPDLVRGAAASGRAWVAVAVVVLVGRLARLAVCRALRRPRLAPWAGTLAVLAGGALLVGPSLRETTLVEPFPAAAALPATDSAVSGAGRPTAPPRPGVSATPRVAAVGTAPATSPARAGGSKPASTHSSTPATTPAGSPAAGPAPHTERPTPLNVSTATATAPPVRLSSARLRGRGHRASGRVAVYLVGGRAVLRFEAVDLQGTPGPSVHLVPRGTRTPGGGRRLGALKAEHGSFGYPLPDGLDPRAAWTVLVWCDPYATPIAVADLAGS